MKDAPASSPAICGMGNVEWIFMQLNRLAGPTPQPQEWTPPHWLMCEDVMCVQCWNRQVHAEYAREMRDMTLHPLG